MNRLVNRVLIALAVPALLIPAASATAAAGTAQVPSIDQVAEIYEHLDGGSAYESTSKVFGPGKKCKPGKAIKGASARSATYNPDYTSGDPGAFEITGETPMVSVTAMKFPSAKSAIAYLHGYDKSAKDCGPGGDGGGSGGGSGGPKCKSSMKKIAFKLGDERYGYQFKMKCKDSASVINTLFTRKGQFIVYANVMSMDASAPSIPKSVDLTELALKTVS
ncbi:hypothetical protein [Nocardioides caricicola]|uniref:Sensor domain-containing protein n=1 Tax=Nocardioides caricicola TaxID=634770 RepID=A0ABW0MUX5_9ACTN